MGYWCTTAVHCPAPWNSSHSSTAAVNPYYILTNDVAKLPAIAATRYRDFGLDLSAERVISAGALLKDYFVEQGLTGDRFHHA